MKPVNRDLIIIKPKSPLIDWINRVDSDNPVSLSDAQKECNVYLIPEGFGIDDAMSLVEQNYEMLFEIELEDWYEDETEWPKNITFAMFREWFEIEYHSVVTDLLDKPIKKR